MLHRGPRDHVQHRLQPGPRLKVGTTQCSRRIVRIKEQQYYIWKERRMWTQIPNVIKELTPGLVNELKKCGLSNRQFLERKQTLILNLAKDSRIRQSSTRKQCLGQCKNFLCWEENAKVAETEPMAKKVPPQCVSASQRRDDKNSSIYRGRVISWV